MSTPPTSLQLPSQNPSIEQETPLDPAQQSLSDALKTSFFILKVTMVIMVVVYLFSGIFTVKPQEKAVRLFFGEVVTDASRTPREYDQGTYWGLPFPIERVVRVPTEPRLVKVDQTFLPKLGEDERKSLSLDELAGKHGGLDPTKDGSLITADANLVHVACKASWEVRGIKNFLTQVGDREKGDRLVRAAAERGLVHAVAKLSADQVLARAGLDESIRACAQNALPAGCGIEISRVDVQEVFAPLSTRKAFAEVSAARSEQDKQVDEARKYAAATLGDAAGPAQESLRQLISLEELANLREGMASPLTLAVRAEISRAFETLTMAGPVVEEPAGAYVRAVSTDDAANLPAARTQLLAALTQAGTPGFNRNGARIEGRTRTLMDEAGAYRTATTQALYAEAHAFEAQLAQYRENPLIFTTRRWQAMREKVFTAPTVETFFLPVERLSIETGRDPETAGRVDDILLEERKRKAGVQ